MTISRPLRFGLGVVLAALCFACAAMGQTETATISGLITDDTGAIILGAEVRLQNTERGTSSSATTNSAGIYVFASVHPGPYQITVEKPGFKQVDFLGLIVNVQDHIEQNFRLQVGSVSESITITGNELNVNTTDAAVSTVVDRQFAENLPMNGRSFQTLIQLTPGVVLTSTTSFDSGQFSVNGQRPASNYWMIDGVGANVGTTPLAYPGNGVGGSVGAYTTLGGTNSLVSVDAMQEFRIQTSTYAPEFGRTPGGQISIVTRSGTNQFHGTAFDYLRNDVFDANDWFANFTKQPKAEERQNDFGGTFAGPILKGKTFFFFSYEGLRLRLPQSALTTVPDLLARQNADSAMQPLLNAYPLPNGPQAVDSAGNPVPGAAEFNASYSNRASVDAYSIRIDHTLSNKVALFGRYNYSPSEIVERGLLGNSLSTVTPIRIALQTATVGTTWAISPVISNELRFNYSRVRATSTELLTSFGGAVVPSIQSLLPSSVNPESTLFEMQVFSLANGNLLTGKNAENLQRQYNLTDSMSLQRGTHSLRLGVDYRRLSPVYNPPSYSQLPLFFDVPSAEKGSTFFTVVTSQRGATLSFQDLGLYAQDTWRATPRISLTYGLRYDIDFAPSSTSGPSLVAVTGFNNPANLALAPAGAPIFATKYGNVAPRVGIAYQISDTAGREMVLRGGFGIFYDLATQEVGGALAGNYPFAAINFAFDPFPLPPAAAAPPVISPDEIKFGTSPLWALDPNLKLPYTREWNLALEQSLGRARSLSLSYVGAAGRRLMATEFLSNPNPNIAFANLVANAGTSDYHAFQAQFQQRLAYGLQVLSSYTWGHSIDTGSASSINEFSNVFSPKLGVNANRGPSDFDIRHAFSVGVTYDIRVRKLNTFADTILSGWSIQSVIQARSAPPVDVFDSGLGFIFPGQRVDVRPDLIPGFPLYLHGGQYPGGKVLNNTPNQAGVGCLGPFCPPPTDPNGVPLRQGNLGRNALRGFGATQWDFAVHRDFPIHESLKLQFRAEMFNVLNHPNFGAPVGDLSNTSQFGQSTRMLGRSLDQGSGGAGFNALYQIGGPRSIQLALKLTF